MGLRKLAVFAALLCMGISGEIARGEAVTIELDPGAAPRVEYGAERLANALEKIGMTVVMGHDHAPYPAGRKIFVGKSHLPSIDHVVMEVGGLKGEGFLLTSLPDGSLAVVGADDSGELYGCLELAERVQSENKLLESIHFTDAPVFKLRGPCIGMQKPFILPGRHTYEYPYTPELFPFFYDKQFWREYLDFLVDHRMNTLYLWSGHPFASLVKLDDYPYAMEVSPDVFKQNVEMFHYIVTEADRRGIWVVQNFYNIIVSKPFAEHNHLESTQFSAPTPLLADYTRKSVAAFVREYPNVGIMFCLGEALQGIDHQMYWCNQVLLPGVKDGMAQAGLTDEPPVVIRTHATDLRIILPEALKVYKNLYTEEKFNGESLTTWEPRGVRQELSLEMSKLGSTHMINVHILANLEPFRYGAQRFIKLCMIAARDRLGARGVHLYPLSYWNWPDAPDIADPPLKQWNRDWIWFDAWSRYAWNPDVDEATDHAYWIGKISAMYGSPAAAENILAAYNDSGECAPRLIRRFGITEGNRQTLSLGMTLDQLVDPEKYKAFPELWESQSPPGERLGEYADRQWNHQKHQGETPPQIISEVLDYSQKAVNEIESATPGVTKNQEEFARVKNDMYCIAAMSQFYAAKVNAAMLVLRYQHSRDPADMEKAADFLAQSVDHYRRLVELTDHAYHFANSMQTGQRQIPFKGAINGKPENYLWSQVLPRYEQELADFRAKVGKIKTGTLAEETVKPLAGADFKLISTDAQTYDVKQGAAVFTDDAMAIQSLAAELRGLTGVRIPRRLAADGKYQPVEFTCAIPVRVLIGYIKSSDPGWLRPPDLETDALAGERGSELLIENAAKVGSLAVDVYGQNYDAGRNKLEVSGSGSFIILGVIPQSASITRRDAHDGEK